jgi:hypothetical protein
LILSGNNLILFLGVTATLLIANIEADLLKWSSEDKCLDKASKLDKDLEQVVQWWGLFSAVSVWQSAR